MQPPICWPSPAQPATTARTTQLFRPPHLFLAACDDRTVRVFNLSDPTAKNITFRKKELRVGVQDVAFGDDNQHVAVQVG